MRRTAFTLIELLVVIAIIGVLVSLLLSAVMRAVIKSEEVKTRNDLSQLATAIQSFKTKFNVEQPPSRIRLCKFYADYHPTGKPGDLDGDSLAYLARVWPRLITTAAGRPAWAASKGRVDWDGIPSKTEGSWVLQGQECLVFFLGGIPTVTNGVRGCSGFSTNPTDPSAHVKKSAYTSADTIKFYDFDAARLKMRSDYALQSTPNIPFFAYADGWGKTPYAYFSAYKTQNGYNRYGLNNHGGISDCSLLPAGRWNSANNQVDPCVLWPYATVGNNGPNYHAANTFQILSAGQDKRFGSGSTNPDGNGPFYLPRIPMYGSNDPGGDDMGSFSDRLLGIPPN